MPTCTCYVAGLLRGGRHSVAQDDVHRDRLPAHVRAMAAKARSAAAESAFRPERAHDAADHASGARHRWGVPRRCAVLTNPCASSSLPVSSTWSRTTSPTTTSRCACVCALCMRPAPNAVGRATLTPCVDPRIIAQLDNLFLQENGRVILGDFGEATFLVESDGSPIRARAGHVIVRGTCVPRPRRASR